MCIQHGHSGWRACSCHFYSCAQPCFDLLSLRRLVVALGSLCCVCGYLGMYLMVAGFAPKNFVQLLIFAAAAGVLRLLQQFWLARLQDSNSSNK